MSTPFIEDMLLPVQPTREIFQYAQKEAYDGVNNRTFPCELRNTQQGMILIELPWDFSALSEWTLKTIVQLGVALNINFTITVSAGKCGELWNTHTANWTGNILHVLNIIKCTDLLALFPAFVALLSAGDLLRITILDNTALSIPWILGSKIRY